MKKEVLTTIIITIFFVLYYVAYFGLIISLISGVLLKVFFGIIPFIFMIFMIKTCIDRIKEIKRGELDDISQY